MHRDITSFDALKLSLELLLRRIDQQATALTEDKFLDFDETIEIARVNLPRENFKHFVLTDKLNAESRVGSLSHRYPRFQGA